MQIGHFVEALEILPDETPGLGQDRDAECAHPDAHASVVGPGVGCVEQAPGRSAAYAS